MLWEPFIYKRPVIFQGFFSFIQSLLVIPEGSKLFSYRGVSDALQVETPGRGAA